ncbi:histidine kinase dimerization/phosphoacceptor domain -containing protein [Methanogenium organophilum]|uniref:Signal transduction histidine kinase subgroup 2 dimerisation and phosphoacceptor domain-containing protein n=1 Tax=Methanogenium organophilum TaxID=2199 RepID=A0A9X9S688_METOG|nr:histidine kinase dimerization/phosphoacceptor domain -containing protein [Methanogenium organophilum]WAI02446.1 hypothetical protein OU421_06120 [Methanogenium organophilum]
MDRQAGREEDLHPDRAGVHRGVADDLRIISSLFEIRMAQVKDEEALCILRELQTLTKVMAIVHGTMYMTGTSEGVGAQLLFEKIVKSVRLTYCTGTWIECTVDCKNTVLPAACAVPCGFVLAEIIRNCVLCSFDGVAEGRIDISLDGPDKDRWYTLIVADDGFPEYALSRENAEEEAISMPVAEHIVRYRLKGTVTRREDEGVTWTVRFPVTG